MKRKVIAGFDGTDQGRDGLALGAMLAELVGARLLLGIVIGQEFPHVPGAEEHHLAEAQHAEAMLNSAGAALPTDLAPEQRVVSARSAPQGLQELAESEHADLIAVGSSHRGAVGRVLLGSTAERLLHGAPCAVAIAPRGHRAKDRGAPRVIGVGFNGTTESMAALSLACAIAEASGASLRLFAVHDPPQPIFGYPSMPAADRAELIRALREELERDLDRTLAQLPGALRAQGSLLSGSPADVIAAEAEKGVDLLVVGSRGYGPLRRVLLGGVSTKLLRMAPCPVLVVPRTAAPSSDASAGVAESTAPNP